MKILIGLWLIFMSCIVQAEIKVAVVDMYKVVQETSAGKKAKATVEEEFNKKKKQLAEKESALQKMAQEIEKKKSVLSEEALKRKQSELQEQMSEYRDFVSRNQLEMQKLQQDLTIPILDKIKKVIDKVTEEKGYDIVLENTPAVLKYSKKLDITDTIIAQVEKEN